MSDPEQKMALATINSLERRLRRVNLLLSGHAEVDSLHERAGQGKEETVLARLAQVENGLGKIASKSPVLADLLKLCRDFPEVVVASHLIFFST